MGGQQGKDVSKSSSIKQKSDKSKAGQTGQSALKDIRLLPSDIFNPSGILYANQNWVN